MKAIELSPIGTIHFDGFESFIQIDSKFRQALRGLDGFGQINVLWWFNNCDTLTSRNVLQIPRPYKGAPDVMGVFATRSPERPNPIALTTCDVLWFDESAGLISVPFIDAQEGSPVLDIKPYTPSFDRVEAPEMPQWCSYWPKSTTESATFDWSQVFNF